MRGRKVLIGAAAVLLALIGIGGFVWWTISGKGGSDLEQWIGAKIVGVLESYVTPRIEFETLDYQAPRTVVIEGLRLTRGDQPMIAVQRALLELAEIPRVGEAIQITRIELDQPDVRFVQRAEGGFVGWSEFLRPGVVENPESVPEGRKFSDVLRMRHVAIRDGAVLFDAGEGESMVLRGIELSLDTPPDPEQPGLYKLAGLLKRDRLFELSIDGSVDVDERVLGLSPVTIAASLAEPQYELFPPNVQALLREHEIQGALDLRLEGSVPIDQIEQTQLRAAVDLRDGRFRWERTLLPFERVDLDAELAQGALDVALDADVLGGRLEASAQGGLWREAADGVSWRVAYEAAGQGGEPLVSITASGSLNGEAQVVEVASLDVAAAISEADYARLPEQIASALQEYSVEGAVELKGSGVVDLEQVERSSFTANATVRDAGATVNGIELPLSSAEIEAELAQQRLSATVAAGVLGGQARALVRADFTQGAVEQVLWEIEYVGESDGEAKPIGLVARGSVNVREEMLDVATFTLDAHLQPDQYEGLPEPIQSFARERGLRGSVSLEAQGSVPLDAPRQAKLSATAIVDDGSIAIQGEPWPLHRIDAEATLADQHVEVRADSDLFGGRAQIQAQADLADGTPRKISWSVEYAAAEEATARLSANGRYDVENVVLSLAELTLSATFSDALRDMAPPPVASFMRERDLRGTLEAQASGAIHFRKAERSELSASAVLLDGSAVFGGTPLAFRRIELEARLAEQNLRATAEAGILGGRATLVAEGGLSGGLSEAVSWQLEYSAQEAGGGNLARLNADGRFEFEAQRLNIGRFDLAAALSPALSEIAPGETPRFLREHDVRGELRAHASGMVDMGRIEQSRLTATAEIRDGRVTFGRAAVPFQSFDAEATIRDGELTASAATGLLGGKAEIKAHGELIGEMPISANWTVAGVDVEQAYQTTGERASPYLGVIESHGSIRSSLTAFQDALSGAGDLHVRNGRLIKLPVVQELADAVELVLPALHEVHNDELDLEFTLHPDHVRLQEASLSTRLMRVNGEGRIYYDDVRLDLRANVNPVDRVTGLLGRLGRRIGDLAGKVVTYRITGTAEEPSVSVAPPSLSLDLP